MESTPMLRHVMILRVALIALVAVGAAGKSPAFAQGAANFGPADAIDLEGSWVPATNEDVSNDTVPVDYTMIPLTDAGRTLAQSYNESQLGMIERQCEGWGAPYLLTGPFGMKISASYEPIKGKLLSYTIPAWEDKSPLVIWMDGRPHPSQYAQHTRGGFTTGRWQDGELVTVTTHMKQGFIRKNGPPLSDMAKMTLHFKRHENTLLVIGIIEDPIYLAEPQIWTRDYVVSVRPLMGSTIPCTFTFEGTALTNEVPHWLWGNKPFQDELTKKYGVPRDAVLGYPETLYPDYLLKMEKMKSASTPETRPGR